MIIDGIWGPVFGEMAIDAGGMVIYHGKMVIEHVPNPLKINDLWRPKIVKNVNSCKLLN